MIVNCIIWGNTGLDASQLYFSSEPNYCCIQNWTGGGEGNIVPPSAGFVDVGGPDNDPETCDDNDYHLRPDSPCIDAGTHEVHLPPNTDMDGEWRPFGVEMDIGADEYVDADRDDLPDYWEIGFFGMLWLEPQDDPDADGLPNAGEFALSTDPNNWDTDSDGKRDGDEAIAGTNPRDAKSLFRIIEIAWSPWGTAIRWSAVPMKSYQCYFSSEMKERWQPFPGIMTAGPLDDSLSVFDWGVSASSRRYYKVEVLP